jgi:hypothetical protein
MFVFLSICLSVFLSICLFDRLLILPSVYLSICQSAHFTSHRYFHFSVRLSICVSVCLSVYVYMFVCFIRMYICLSYRNICLSVHPSLVCLSVKCLSIDLSVFLLILRHTLSCHPLPPPHTLRQRFDWVAAEIDKTFSFLYFVLFPRLCQDPLLKKTFNCWNLFCSTGS